MAAKFWLNKLWLGTKQTISAHLRAQGGGSYRRKNARSVGANLVTPQSLAVFGILCLDKLLPLYASWSRLVVSRAQVSVVCSPLLVV
jgi:hypothetical protein